MLDEFDDDFFRDDTVYESDCAVTSVPQIADDFTEAKPRDLPVSDHVVFDFETSPAWHPGDSIDAAKAYCQPLGIEYDPASIGEHPGVWKPESVKIGNLRDPVKIDEKLDAARKAHWQSVVDFEKLQSDGEPAFWKSIIENAALSPVTGRVLAAGYCVGGKVDIDYGSPSEPELRESNILRNFWLQFEDCREIGRKMPHWNGNAFDIPFARWRSAKLGVEIPRGLYRGRYPCDTFVDMMDSWPSLFSPWKQKSAWLSAKDAARFLGCSRPADEIEGKDFWRHFLGTSADREKAIRYLTNDVTEETVIAKALGVI